MSRTTLSQEEKIIEAFKEGLTYKQIQLRCGNPSKKQIKAIIKARMPEVYKFISDVDKINNWRDKQFEESIKE